MKPGDVMQIRGEPVPALQDVVTTCDEAQVASHSSEIRLARPLMGSGTRSGAVWTLDKAGHGWS